MYMNTYLPIQFFTDVHVRYTLSSVRLSSVLCLSSVCNVRSPYLVIEISGNVSMPFGQMAIY